MKIIPHIPGIGLVHLGPNVDDATATLRAEQLSYFMRNEVHGPVYEDEFGLPFIDPDPPSGTPGDIPWRIEGMKQSNTVQPNGTYREYIIAAEHTGDEQVSASLGAIAGLLVVTKPSLCTATVHYPSHIAEIDVAQNMRGTGLALHMLQMLTETHPQDPSIDMVTYERNLRSQNFHGKLGFVIDQETPPQEGEVYKGNWIRMVTDGTTFYRRLNALLES